MRSTLAWALYWMGHAVSRLDRFDNERLCNCWYPVYNRLMNWSAAVQGPGPKGPWVQSIG